MKTRFLPLSSLFLPSLTFLLIFCATQVATAQVPSYVPTNGLVGYWPFNGNANDESGNGNNGTVNGPTLTADRFGDLNSAYNFSGSTIDIPHNPNLGIQQFQGFTVSIWALKDPSISLTHLIAKRPQGAQNFNWHIADWEGLQFTATSAPNVFGAISTQSTNTQTWDHIVGIYNNGLWQLYVNGILLSSVQSSFFQSDVDTPVTIGNSGGWGGFLGSLDDLAIWNRALTADEVLALYNGCNVTPIAIAGNNTPGAFSTSTYTCDNNAGSTYNWTVSNGVIAGGQGTNSVNILWGAEGVGSVSVVETTADGCVGDAVVFDVNVQCVVSGNAIDGPVGPEAFSNSTYTCNGAANSNYQWTITNGVIVSGQGTSSVTVLWASTGIGNISVVETTAEGCVGTTLSQDVVVVPVSVEEFTTAISLFPNPATTELNLQTTAELIGSDLIIFDALGKQIHKQQIISTNTRINTSAFAAGNYVVKVGEVVKRFEVKK
jgi:hypothetical protein